MGQKGDNNPAVLRQHKYLGLVVKLWGQK